MKNIKVLAFLLLISTTGYTQRILEWSIGEAEITCGTTIKMSYPLLVSAADESNSPVLGSTTMRFIYDAGSLHNFEVQNVENGYTISGLTESNPVLGEIFGFETSEGIFVQFDILDNARVDPLNLSREQVHVLDFVFELDEDVKFPLCASFVLDNNPDGWGKGIEEDDGYIPGSAGIVGSYYLNNVWTTAYDADDEVINIFWKRLNGKVGKIRKGFKVGSVNRAMCLKNNICKGNNDKGNNVDLNDDVTLNIYPVPFDEEVFISYKFDYDTDVIIKVYDSKGALIKYIENYNYRKDDQVNETLDLKEVQDQVLFVQVITNESIQTKKIVPVTN